MVLRENRSVMVGNPRRVRWLWSVALVGLFLCQWLSAEGITETQRLVAEASQPRTRPAHVLRIATFNVQNLFNGEAGDFSRSRGARDRAGFQRQVSKLAHAIAHLDADILILNELENDHGRDSALAELLRQPALQNDAGPIYREVNLAPRQFGHDRIRNSIIYRDGRLQVLDSRALENARLFSRYPLAALFALPSGERILVVAVHFKSKAGCHRARKEDREVKKGEGCFGHTRLRQARALVEWVGQLQQDWPDAPVVVAGDVNDYPHQPAAQWLLSHWTSVLTAGQPSIATPDEVYSVVYRRKRGLLDYLLVDQDLEKAVEDAGIWHINAQIAYACGVFRKNCDGSGPLRSSDHDPAWLDLAIPALHDSSIPEKQPSQGQ